MKLKLSNKEIDTLATIMEQACVLYKESHEPEDALYLSIFEELRITIEQKRILRKNEYSMKLKPYQAIAFWVCFNPLPKDGGHGSNLVMMLCNGIHQQYQLPCS